MSIVSAIEIMRRTRLEGTVEFVGAVIEYLGRDWRFGGRYRVSILAIANVIVTGPVTLEPISAGIEQLVKVDTSDAAWPAGGGTITLPAEPNANSIYVIKDVGGQALSHPITVDGNGGNIDGEATRDISSNYESWRLWTDGTDYWRC